jgi:hypothetical protein
MIRALRPTDLLSYLAFRRQNPDNEALGGADGQALSTNLGEFLGDTIALDSRRAHWALFDRGAIQGLVAVRARFGADIWDIERLVLAPTADYEPTIGRLLDHVLRQGAEEGVQKVFLRIREGSESLVAARRAGFHRYVSEHVFRSASDRAATIPPDSVDDSPVLIRPRRPAHHQPIFQLYTAAVPGAVRQVEGMTLQEWRWTDGWQVGAIPWSSDVTRRQDFVALGPEGIAGWLQVDFRTRMLSLLVSGRPDVARLLIEFGTSQLGAAGHQRLVLRDYQAELATTVADLGFIPGERHALLARTIAIRIPEGKLVPVQAS